MITAWEKLVAVQLTAHNMFMAALVGVSRHVKDMARIGKAGQDKRVRGWQDDCDGACGEAAVAKWLGVFYDGALGDFAAKDAGHVQVRTTPRASGCLIVRDHDADDDIYILVLSHDAPNFILAGWIRGCDAKQGEWRDAKGTDRPAAFFVPQEALKVMDEFPR